MKKLSITLWGPPPQTTPTFSCLFSRTLFTCKTFLSPHESVSEDLCSHWNSLLLRPSVVSSVDGQNFHHSFCNNLFCVLMSLTISPHIFSNWIVFRPVHKTLPPRLQFCERVYRQCLLVCVRHRCLFVCGRAARCTTHHRPVRAGFRDTCWPTAGTSHSRWQHTRQTSWS